MFSLNKSVLGSFGNAEHKHLWILINTCSHMSVGALSYSLFFYIDFLSYSLSIPFFPSLLAELFQIHISISNFSGNQQQYISPHQCTFHFNSIYLLYSLVPMKGVPFLVRQQQDLRICLCNRSQVKVNKTEIIKVKITTDCA